MDHREHKWKFERALLPHNNHRRRIKGPFLSQILILLLYCMLLRFGLCSRLSLFDFKDEFFAFLLNDGHFHYGQAGDVGLSVFSRHYVHNLAFYHLTHSLLELILAVSPQSLHGRLLRAGFEHNFHYFRRDYRFLSR